MQFFTILMMCILAGAEVDLFIPSFPELQQVFQLSPFLVEFTLGANFCAYCLGSLVAGNLGDRYGRRPIILLGCFIFIVGSLLCALAPSFSILILGRIFQGLGISGPAVLAYVVIADTYSAQEQPKLLGILNGMVTLAMAFAPVLGSYVNLFFNWRGNFYILLMLGLLSLIMGIFYIRPSIPSAKQKKVSLSLKTYLPIFKSKPALAYIFAISFCIVPYWVFIGMAPILYMQDMNVSLQTFGFYQGALAATFSVISLCSGQLLKHFGQKLCVNVGLGLCGVSMFLMMILAIKGIQSPFLVTGALMFLSAGIVFPIHVLYPYSLEVIDNAKGRMAAIILAVRLLLTAMCLEIVGYLYKGHFSIIAYSMCFCLCIGLACIYLILKKYLKLGNLPTSMEANILEFHSNDQKEVGCSDH